MDRLLSEQEITLIVGWPSAFEYAKIVELNKAQLLKTDKEWAEWGRTFCNKVEHGGAVYQATCANCWQERTKEIGL